MAMTYAALAKSLGITLKSSSSSASTASSAGSLSVPAPTHTPAPASTSKPPEPLSSVSEKRRGEVVSTPVPTASTMNVNEEAQEAKAKEATKAHDRDSDIASSRSTTPDPAPAAEEKRKPENLLLPPTGASEDADTGLAASLQQSVDINKDLTDEQLHHAKLLVLDLLGWGVPPEYLLQRGVSHALLYTVFTDLRLRLPEGIVADCVALVAAQT